MTGEAGGEGQRPVHAHLMLGLPLAPRGPAYTAARLGEAWRGPGLDCTLYSALDLWTGAPLALDVVAGGGAWMGRAGRLFARRLQRRAEARLLTAIARELREARVTPVAYMFGEVSLESTRVLAAAGVPVVREKFNCAKATARAILEAEHRRLGLPPFTEIDDAAMEKEAEELRLAHAVFSPSPLVSGSLRAAGVPEKRILETSYGWEPERLSGTSRALPPIEGPTLVFVGLSCVRKGSHILLEAWERAVDRLGVRGRLLLAGKVDAIIAERNARQLARPDVVQLGFVDDVGAVYRSSDWFVFPTLEEGDPLVTYEALGSGVPALVSPMGGGAVVEHDVNGRRMTSLAPEAWAEAIAALPTGRALEPMRRAARERAQDYVWAQVGRDRRRLLFEALRLPPPAV